MPRRPRIEKAGFYHIINRGVEQRDIFLDDTDHIKFLELLEDSADVYFFSVYSYCLMDNHYHLLLQTTKKNLSLIMRQINSRYSIYFNNKYTRVGPLWQGRFKSWFVYDISYLKALVKYIEFNPVKANRVKKVGQFRWSMSSYKSSLKCANYELIEVVDFSEILNDQEQLSVHKIFNARLEIKEDKVVNKKIKCIEAYFFSKSSKHKKKNLREVAIAKAIQDGYTQIRIGNYLGLSNIAVSKIFKIYKQKTQLFNKLRDKGLFWSYSKDITYDEAGEKLFCEYLLKYADFDDICLGFQLFGTRAMKKIWEEQLRSEKRFIKLNLMIARVFFNMDIEGNYFKGIKNARFEKLKLLAL